MKLNLIPPSASRGTGSKFAWILAVAIIAGSVYGAISMKAAGQAVLVQARNDVAEISKRIRTDDPGCAERRPGDCDFCRSHIESGPGLSDAGTQFGLSKVLYEIFQYIPSYFRFTSLQAQPTDGNTCTVTMQGTIGSFQQYANLMLALLRIRGAQAVSRSGYQLNDLYVPPLEEDDQVGRPIKMGQVRLTDDPIQRLDVKIAQASATDYVGTGGFGTPGIPMQRGATPDESLITVAVVVTRNLMTPNPRSTLAGGTAAFAASASTVSDAGAGTAAPAQGGL